MRSNYARSVVKKGLVTGLDDRIFGSFFFQLEVQRLLFDRMIRLIKWGYCLCDFGCLVMPCNTTNSVKPIALGAEWKALCPGRPATCSSSVAISCNCTPCTAKCDMMYACSVTEPWSAVNLNMVTGRAVICQLLVSADLREEIRVLSELHGIYLLLDIIFVLPVTAISSSLFPLMVRSKQ